MDIKTLADADFRGRTVLVRVDFNVPMSAEGESPGSAVITSDRRIVQALPTLQALLAIDGVRLVLLSHLGRPAGKGLEPEYSLAPVAQRLEELLGRPVTLGPPEVVGPEAAARVASLPAGGVLLLENVRFCAAETLPDKASKNPDKRLTDEQNATLDAFVAALASLGDAYVNDAFGTCHRKHASMFGLPKAIASRGQPAVAGLLVEKEARFLGGAIANPRRPFVAVLGGAKVSDKIPLIEQLLPKVDHILVGGAMAYTLLRARGVALGKSRVEADRVEAMAALLERAGDKVVLPVDHVVTDRLELARSASAEEEQAAGGRPSVEVTAGVEIPHDRLGVDIGPLTRALFAQQVRSAGLVVWNGPMGVFENPAFAAGTEAVANALVDATRGGAVTIVGGGDSAAAIEDLGLDAQVSHVSTGGGASLEFLEGRAMPPLQVLVSQRS